MTPEQLSDPVWRIRNLYHVQDKSGRKVVFKPWPEQEYYLRNMHYCNIILKARQRGFSTLIELMALDKCLFQSDFSAGIIAHKLPAAERIFDTKIKYPYDNLDPVLLDHFPADRDSARTLKFANGSQIHVDASLRGGTYQFLHISEHGNICAKNPDKAREIREGAFNTVQAGNEIHIESTAEGKSGDFYRMCTAAMNFTGKLTPLDFKFFFFPWHFAEEYRLGGEVPVPAPMREYFEALEGRGIKLDRAQKNWYVKKAAQQGEGMKKEFPSYPEEAFEQAIEGAYFYKELSAHRENITRVAYDPRVEVNTFWDLGRSDSTAIWFWQQVGPQRRMIDYYEASGESLEHYVKVLRKKDYNYGRCYVPHDADYELLGQTQTIAQQLRRFGFKVKVGQRVRNKLTAIEAARSVIATTFFDEERCSVGLDHLHNYRKKWNEREGRWSDEPVHDSHSHGADAFMEYAMTVEKTERTDQPRRIIYRHLNQYA